MRATWFENRELITLYTNPAYFGADVPKSYAKRPSKPVPVDSLFGYEPSSKMADIHHKNSVLDLALKMKTGSWGGKPIVVRKDPKGYQVLDGHHRMHAARKAGLETLPAVIVGAEDIQYSDSVREQVEEGWSAKYKKSIDCSNPKGFSQKAHCAGRKKKKNESIRESYEIEFVCVNPNFCDATEQKNQDRLFQALRAVPGIIVYKQDFDEHNSMAAIIKDEADTDAPKLIQKIAQQHKVAIDLENDVSQSMMDDIITGRLEGLTDYYDTDSLSEAKANESIPSPDKMGKPTLPSLQNTIQDLNDLIKDLDKGKPQPKEIILDPEDYREKRKKFKQQGKPYMITKVQEVQVDEGVNDPHIFKAVFMAGGPGSGKSFVAQNILGGTGLRAVNSDEVYEFLLKRQGLSLDPDTIASTQGQEIRGTAKDLTAKRQQNYIDGRIGLLIDGTGKNVSVIQDLAQKLKSIGYSVSMIFVNTSLEVAQQRNRQRDRVLPANLVADSWNEVQQNLMKYQQIFGADRFHIVDNSGGLEDLDRQKNFDKVYNEVQRFLNTPPKHKKALEWIKNQKAQNNAKPTTNSGKSDGGVTSTN